MFYSSKEASMIERCLIAASDIAQLEVLNASTVAAAVEQMGNLAATRLIVTNHKAQVIFDSTAGSPVGTYAFLPEILQALKSILCRRNLRSDLKV